MKQALLFNPTRASTEELERTFVARHSVLEQLEKGLLADQISRTPRHWQILGPRGSGKSHLTELLARRMRDRHDWRIARLPEENYQVASLGELLHQVILRSEYRSGSLFDDVANDDDLQEKSLDELRRLSAIHGRPLLVVLENLGSFFGRQLKSVRDQARLRDILTNDPPFVMVATSTSVADATTKYSAPLYEFFQSLVLQDLSADDIADLIKARAGWEKNSALLANFEEVRNRVDAVYHLSGGNPRLALALYNVVQDGVTAELHDQLMRLLDEVTPYYQARLTDIPPQALRVLTEMAVADTVCTPAEIARRCRMPTNQVTAQIRKLIDERFVAAGTKPDARRRYYEFKDRLLRIWIQMRETGGSERRLRFLAEFYERWYAGHDDELQEAGRRAVSELWSDLIDGNHERCGDRLKTLSYLAEIKPGFDDSVVLRAIIEHVQDAAKSDVQAHLTALRDLFEKASDLPEREALAVLLSQCYIAIGEEAEAVPFLQRVVDAGSNRETIADRLGDGLIAGGRYEAAWKFGSSWLARHPSHAMVLGSTSVAALALGQIERGISLLSRYVSTESCPHCAREVAIHGLRVAWPTASEDVRGNLWRLLPSGGDLPRGAEAREAIATVLFAERPSVVPPEEIKRAVKAWPDQTKTPVWFLSRAICSLTHKEGHAADALSLIELAARQVSGNLVQFLVNHLVEVLPELRQNAETFHDEKLSSAMRLVRERTDPKMLAHSFASRAPVLIKRRRKLARQLLELHKEWLSQGVLAEPITPYAEAAVVLQSDNPAHALSELHPETREAVSLLLGDVNESFLGGQRRARK